MYVLLSHRLLLKAISVFLVIILLVFPPGSRYFVKQAHATPLIVLLLVPAAIIGAVYGGLHYYNNLKEEWKDNWLDHWDWGDFIKEVGLGMGVGIAGVLILVAVAWVVTHIAPGVAISAASVGAWLYQEHLMTFIPQIVGTVDVNQISFSYLKNTFLEFQTEITNTLEDIISDAGEPTEIPSFTEISADFSKATIQETNISISTGSGMEYNSAYGESWRMLYPGTSYLEGTFNLDSVPSGVLLKLIHLSSMSESAPGGGYSPVDIIINGQVFKDNYDVAENHEASHSYGIDTWQIADYLQTGINMIRVEFEDDPWAYTHYWIQDLVITPGDLGPGAPPIPFIKSDCSSIDLSVGEQKSVTFTVINHGNDTSLDAYLTLSVSDGLDIMSWNSDDGQYSGSNPNGMRFSHKYPGDSDYDKNGNPITLQEELLDCYEKYDQNETRTITVTFKAVSSGSQWIKYRATFDDAVEGINYVNDPASEEASTSDQQGWNVFNIPVTAIVQSADNFSVNHTELWDINPDCDDDGIVETGETIDYYIYLKNKSSQNWYDVNAKLNLSTPNPDFVIVKDDGWYGNMAAGSQTEGFFRFDTLNNFTGTVNFTLDVYYKDSSGNPYQDIETVSVTVYTGGSTPNFVHDGTTFFDTVQAGTSNDGDGILESGESYVDFKTKLKNTGGGPATYIWATIDQVYLGPGEVLMTTQGTYPDILPGNSAEPSQTWLLHQTPGNFSGPLNLHMTIKYGPDQTDIQELDFSWTVSPVPYLGFTSIPSWDFGTVSPGTLVSHDFSFKNVGSADLTVSSIVPDNPDTNIIGISTPTVISPGSTQTFTAEINTTGLNGYITRNITLTCDCHGKPIRTLTITGTVAPDIDSPELRLTFQSSKIHSSDGYNAIIKNIGIADLDGDGKTDIALAADDVIYVFENTGNNSYQEVWNSGSTIGGYIHDQGFALGDTDNDGKMEIVVGNFSSPSDKVCVFENTGDNSYSKVWDSGASFTSVRAVEIADDLDNDGSREIVVISYADKSIHILENTGSNPNSYSDVWVSGALGGYGNPTEICVADTDSDGNKDIIVIAGTEELYIFENTGNNAFTQRLYWRNWSLDPDFVYLANWYDNSEIAIGDVDNDTKKEIIIGCGGGFNSSILLIENTGNDAYDNKWSIGLEEMDTGSMYGTTIGDIDSDGNKEIIVGKYAKPGVYVYENFADNSYKKVWDNGTAEIQYAWSIATGDTDNDGRNEIIAGSNGGDLYVYENSALPDLAISANNISFSSPEGVEGSSVTISAIINNIERWNANDVVVRYFDGDPASGGTQIDGDRTIALIPAGQAGSTEVSWTPTQAGNYSIYVKVDPDYTIEESTETNNVASKNFTVNDDDVIPPSISSVTKGEYEGDGDGDIEIGEKVKISWQASDFSGIKTSSCTVSELLTSTTYYAIGGPYNSPGTYNFEIRATDNDNSPETTVYVSEFLIRDNSPPTAPQASCSPHSDENNWYSSNNPSLSWTTPTDASGISGYSCIIDHFSTTVPPNTIIATNNSKIYYNLADGEWFFHVRARDGSGNWGDTNHFKIKIDVSPPAGFTSISFSNVQTSIMNVVGNALSDGYEGNEYYQFNCMTDSKWDRTWLQDSNIYECSEMSPNTKYTFRYQVKDGLGNCTEWSNSYSKYTLANPPTGLSVVSAVANAVALSWDANSNPSWTHYGIASSMDNFTANVSTSVVFADNLMDTTGFIFDLTPGTSYWFRVWAYNGEKVQTSYDGPIIIRTALTGIWNPPRRKYAEEINTVEGIKIKVEVPDTAFNTPTKKIEINLIGSRHTKFDLVQAANQATKNRGVTQAYEIIITDYLNNILSPDDFHDKIKLTFTYPPDLSLAQENQLRIFRLNEATRRWEEQDDCKVNAVAKTISLDLNHLSIYKVMSKVTEGFEELIVYPNPFKVREAKDGLVKFINLPNKVTLQIYSIAGELVYDKEYVDTKGGITWSGKNNSGKRVATGIYVYLLKGDNGHRKKGRLSVIW